MMQLVEVLRRQGRRRHWADDGRTGLRLLPVGQVQLQRRDDAAVRHFPGIFDDIDAKLQRETDHNFSFGSLSWGTLYKAPSGDKQAN